MNTAARDIFKRIFQREFDRKDPDDAIAMQCAIYLLQARGIDIGNYAFTWWHGHPYCDKLAEECRKAADITADVSMSNDALSQIQALTHIVQKDTAIHTRKYTEIQWVDCMASMYYIRRNMLPICNSQDNEVIAMIKLMRPDLNTSKDNKAALQDLNMFMTNHVKSGPARELAMWPLVYVRMEDGMTVEDAIEKFRNVIYNAGLDLLEYSIKPEQTEIREL